MSTFAATQIAKPSDEQAFERACVTLWRCILNDQNVQRNGRRDQRQNGVDLYGVRNNDPTHLVGIQCKLKGPEQVLSTKEVRDEFSKALTFSPPLVEYFIVTTSPDDVSIQELARTLAADLAQQGRRIAFQVWGWNTLEERISEHADALRAFDASYGTFSEQTLEQINKIADSQSAMRAEIASGLSHVLTKLTTSGILPAFAPPDDSAGTPHSVDQALHAEIDGYRDLSNDGKPRTALALLDRLWTRIKEHASAQIQFRIKANIGSCYLVLLSQKMSQKAAARDGVD